jgi:hypothetical protein
MKEREISRALAILGAVALIVCISLTAFYLQPSSDDAVSAEMCGAEAAKAGVYEEARKVAVNREKAAAEKGSEKVAVNKNTEDAAVDDTTWFWGNASDKLTLHYVWPKRTSFEHTLCLIVSGASAAMEKNPDQSVTIPLSIFLNNLRADHLEQKAKPIATPQTILITLTAQEDASKESAEFWRQLLHSDSGFSEKSVAVGLSRSRTDAPEVVMKRATVLIVFYKGVTIAGAVALSLLIISFILYVRQSSILRDGDQTWTGAELDDQRKNAQALLDASPAGETDDAKKTRVAGAEAEIARLNRSLASLKGPGTATSILRGTYSLAKSQMAFWLILSSIGFVFIWLSTGQYQNLVTPGILVLLGISGASGLAAVQLTDESAAKRPSGGFLFDILSDEHGPQLYRLQAFMWTLILGAIFIWHVVYNFRFVDFDNNLLILMGISHSVYLGFKARDALG